MFTNRPGCTVWEKTKSGREPAYVRHVLGPCYWQPSHGETGGADRAPQNDDFVSLPAASVTYLPKKDDRIADSITEAATPPADALTVKNVKDLRYGSPRVQHVEITAR